MSDYFATFDGIKRDELQGGDDAIPTSIWNINVAPGTTIERGMLLAADTPTGDFAQVSSADDAKKVLCIARDNFVADDEDTVTQAYASGVFNKEKIKLGGTSSLTIDPFINQLRKSNIHIRHLREVFGKMEY